MFRQIFTLVLCCLFLSLIVPAQETTSSLSGYVSDANGAFVAGATVAVTHESTGYKTATQSNSKGYFTCPT